MLSEAWFGWTMENPAPKVFFTVPFITINLCVVFAQMGVMVLPAVRSLGFKKALIGATPLEVLVEYQQLLEYPMPRTPVVRY